MSYYKNIDLKMANIRLGDILQQTTPGKEKNAIKKDTIHKHVYTEMETQKKEMTKHRSGYLNEEKETAKKYYGVKSNKEAHKNHDSAEKHKGIHKSPESSKKDSINFNAGDIKAGDTQFE